MTQALTLRLQPVSILSRIYVCGYFDEEVGGIQEWRWAMGNGGWCWTVRSGVSGLEALEGVWGFRARKRGERKRGFVCSGVIEPDVSFENSAVLYLREWQSLVILLRRDIDRSE